MPHLSANMKLLSQNRLLENGGVGEGISMQQTADGRRILWLAHEGPPANFTAVDVTDPRRTKVVVQTRLPHMQVRSNSLEVSGNLMAVAYQTVSVGLQPAGVELFDISTPESPKSIAFFDCSGPHSRGVHALWFVDGEYVHCATGFADFQPRNPLDDQFYMIIDVRNPAKPLEAGRWWLPGTRVGDAEPAPQRLSKLDAGFRAHNTNVYPQRPDRAYVGYIDGGAVILDIADKSTPKVVSRWNPAPPFMGFTHTVLPLFSRDLLVVSEESVVDAAQDWPKLTWIVDARHEANLVPISLCPLPAPEEFGPKGGRYGSHNLHENHPSPLAFRSDTLIFGAYFNGGVRVFDIADPTRPVEAASFVPEPPAGSRINAVQINDIYVDEQATVYAVDRYAGGLYVLELDI